MKKMAYWIQKVVKRNLSRTPPCERIGRRGREGRRERGKLVLSFHLPITRFLTIPEKICHNMLVPPSTNSYNPVWIGFLHAARAQEINFSKL